MILYIQIFNPYCYLSIHLLHLSTEHTYSTYYAYKTIILSLILYQDMYLNSRINWNI